jgi:hypothetical protein
MAFVFWDRRVDRFLSVARRASGSFDSRQISRLASQTLTRDGVSFPRRQRFSRAARMARASWRAAEDDDDEDEEEEEEEEEETRSRACAILMDVSAERSTRSSSCPPEALPDDCCADDDMVEEVPIVGHVVLCRSC